MPEIERLTITLPYEKSAAVKDAVASGDYASVSEVVRDALRDWKVKRAVRLAELTGLPVLDPVRQGGDALLEALLAPSP